MFAVLELLAAENSVCEFLDPSLFMIRLAVAPFGNYSSPVEVSAGFVPTTFRELSLALLTTTRDMLIILGFKSLFKYSAPFLGLLSGELARIFLAGDGDGGPNRLIKDCPRCIFLLPD